MRGILKDLVEGASNGSEAVAFERSIGKMRAKIKHFVKIAIIEAKHPKNDDWSFGPEYHAEKYVAQIMGERSYIHDR